MIGAGIVGINAVRVAHALGAEVDVLDVDLRRLTYLYDIFPGELNTLFSNRANIERSVRRRATSWSARSTCTAAARRCW